MTECIVTSSVLIAVIISVRFLFRGKISRRLQYALWGLVLLRLLIPFPMAGSPLSIMNAAPKSLAVVKQLLNEMRQSSIKTNQPVNKPILTDIETKQPLYGATDNAENINNKSADSILSGAAPDTHPGSNASMPGKGKRTPDANIGNSDKNMDNNEGIRLIWMIGSITVGLWITGVNFMFYRKLLKTRRPYNSANYKTNYTTHFELPVYISENIASPCLFGLLHPAVYLTPKAADNNTGYVLAHELSHYRHGDHVWSLLRSICLAVYWWNPLIWIAAILSCTDSELACDETVIKQIGEKNRMAYGHTLIDMIAVKSTPSGIMYAATTMVSGKNGIKTRLNMIVKNPKTFLPALAAVLIVVVVCIGVTFTGAQNINSHQGSSGSDQSENNGNNKSGGIGNTSSYARKLYDRRNQYIGNASADGALLQTMNISKNLGKFTIELETEKEPYFLRIIFTDKISDSKALDRAMGENAMLLLALIDNASKIQWQYYGVNQVTGRDSKFTASLSRGNADSLLKDDIKSYGKSAGKVKTLLDWLVTNSSVLNENTGLNVTATAGSPKGIDRTNLEACITDAILSGNINHYGKSDFATEAHTVLKTVVTSNTTTVYTMALYLEFRYSKDRLTETGGSHIPVAITFEKGLHGEYQLKEYWMPQNGSYYAPSIKGKFPPDIYGDALDTQKYILAETQNCYANAVDYGKVDTDTIISSLITVICSSPKEASNPGVYIDAHPIDYRELLFYGDYTLKYAYKEFLKGGQTDLEGQVLLAAMRKLLGGEDLKLLVPGTAQDWFEEFKNNAVRLLNLNPMEFMEEHYPKTAILLKMLE